MPKLCKEVVVVWYQSLLFETGIYIMGEIVNGALSSLRPFLGLESRFFCTVVLTHKT